MIFKVLIVASAILLVSCDDKFGVSSAFLHFSAPPKQVSFIELGEYSNKKILKFVFIN